MTSKRTLNLSISVWYRPEDEHIHIRIDGKTKKRMSTVSDNNSLQRGHPHLFNHLKEELVAAGMWNRISSDNK